MAFSMSAVSEKDLFLKMEIVFRCFSKSMIFVVVYHDVPCKT